MKRILIFFFLLSTLNVPLLYSQADTKGTDFVLSFANNNNQAYDVIIAPPTPPMQFQIRIVADAAASGTITFTDITGAGRVVPFTVAANSVHTHTLSVIERGASYSQSTGKSNKSVLIHSDVPVTVYAFNTVQYLADATNILPTPALGNEYYHLGRANGIIHVDQYLIVATQNNTIIYENGTPVETLSAGQVYFKQAGSEVDMSGYHITSNNPIAYFSVHNYNQINGGGDNIFQQLTPVNTWGKDFIVPVSRREVELIRIIASQNGTTITQTGARNPNSPYNPIPATITLNAGQWVEWRVTLADKGCYIQADKPVQICSYMVGRSYGHGASGDGDEGFVNIPPIEQSVNSALIAPFAIPSFDEGHFVLVVTPTATKNNTTMSIGGAVATPLPSGGTWYDNSASGMSFYNVQLTELTSSYVFENPAGLVIYGYGFGYSISYYYMAASALRNLEASFYVNDVHNQDIDGQILCDTTFNVRAALNFALHPSSGRLRWYIDGVEQTSAVDQEQWTMPALSLNTPHEIKMVARNTSNETFTITSTITTVNCKEEYTICSGEKATLTASLEMSGSVINPVYRWYSAANGGTLLHTGPTFTTATAITSDTTFYVSVEGDNYCEGDRQVVNVKVEDCANYVSKDATLLLTPPFPHNGTYPNPVSVLYNEEIRYDITAINANPTQGTDRKSVV